MPMGSCPLCGLEANIRPHEDYDRDRVRCRACGRYQIEGLTRHAGIDDTQRRKLHVLSYLARSASDSGGYLVITQDNLNSLLDSVVEFPPLEKMARTLLYINGKLERPDVGIEVDLNNDFPLVMARDSDEFETYLGLLIERGEVEATNWPHGDYGPIRLTPDGWERVTQLMQTQTDSNQAFVAMWFDPGLQEAWDNGFKPALESVGFTPYRVDQDPHNEKIDDRIIAEIRRSGLLVADVTGHRQGVYFESGFAMGLGIQVFWTCRNTDIELTHFDTRQYNHVVWDDPEDLRQQLATRIAANIPGRQIQREPE